MKVIGYGWIRAGETLETAMERYGVNAEKIIQAEHSMKTEKELLLSSKDAKKDFKKNIDDKSLRKSAKARVFRLILEEVK